MWLTRFSGVRSARGFVFRTCAENGQRVWFDRISSPGKAKVKLLLRLGSAARTGSSKRGARSTGAPWAKNKLAGSITWGKTYTLPPPDHARPKESRSLFRSEHALYDGVVSKEFVELRNELLELPESQEAAVLGPSWANHVVALLSEQEVARVDHGLPWCGGGSEPFNCRLTDPIHETEVCSLDECQETGDGLISVNTHVRGLLRYLGGRYLADGTFL